jgi:hypothetical protein
VSENEPMRRLEISSVITEMVEPAAMSCGMECVESEGTYPWP